jgi:hypothetical protein
MQPVVIDIPASLATLFPTIPPWTDVVADAGAQPVEPLGYAIPEPRGHRGHFRANAGATLICRVASSPRWG